MNTKLIPSNRLTYSFLDRILIVEIPWSIHEMLLTDFRDCICKAINSLPYDRYTLRAKVEMNLPFQSSKDGFTATPDLSLLLASLMDPPSPEIPLLVECAFSQDRDGLWTKLRGEIDVHPEVVLVVVIIITETPDYHSPEGDSDAWNQFVKEDHCRDCKSFLGLKNRHDAGGAQSLCVEVAGHVWCKIVSADYYVWVKDDTNHRVDIDSEYRAHGVSRIANLSWIYWISDF